MSKIQEYLKQIASAIYGKDVRQSIINAIKQCYEDASEGLVPSFEIKEIETGVEVTIVVGMTSKKFVLNDGVTIKINSTEESSEDDGNNVITFSDGTSLKVKNGSKGNRGDKGTSSYEHAVLGGYQGTEEEFNIKLADIMGYEYLEYDILGEVDLEKNIILTGELPNGTYVLKYENVDGTYSNIGNLVIGNVLQYSITESLVGCTSANSNADIINEGETITLKYIANDSFVFIDTVVVTGADYTWNSTTGTLILKNPIEDITVTITATKSGYNNLADPTATGWVHDSRISSSNTAKAEGSCEGAEVTNYIMTPKTCTFYIKGLDIVNNLPDGNVPIHTRHSSMDESSFIGKIYGNAIASDVTVTGDVTKISSTKLAQAGEYIRFTGTLLDGYTANDVVITIDEPITN